MNCIQHCSIHRIFIVFRKGDIQKFSFPNICFFNFFRKISYKLSMFENNRIQLSLNSTEFHSVLASFRIINIHIRLFQIILDNRQNT